MEMDQSELGRALLEGYHEYDEIRCDGCDGTPVDLSDADDFDEAVEIWNAHVREKHPDEEDDA